MCKAAPIEITSDEARKLAQTAPAKAGYGTVFSFGGKWYDVRHMSIVDVVEYLTSTKRDATH